MDICIRRLSSLTLISLLSFFCFAAQTGTPDNSFDRRGGPTELRGTTGKTHKASAAVAASGYSYSVLYSFCSAPNCTDGATSAAGLIQDAAGNLYGTTTAGGGNSNSSCGSNGCGTVFELDNTGHETVLYSFCTASNCTDGAPPQAGLIRDAAGNLSMPGWERRTRRSTGFIALMMTARTRWSLTSTQTLVWTTCVPILDLTNSGAISRCRLLIERHRCFRPRWKAVKRREGQDYFVIDSRVIGGPECNRDLHGSIFELPAGNIALSAGL
jgi:uncharacterized repeat protein (TIGR03803 family)